VASVAFCALIVAACPDAVLQGIARVRDTAADFVLALDVFGVS
jgi:hypothetical protein